MYSVRAMTTTPGGRTRCEGQVTVCAAENWDDYNRLNDQPDHIAVSTE